MRNVTISLVKTKSMVENDANFSGSSSRVLAYCSIETEDGVVVNGISVRQSVSDRKDIRVCYPSKKVYDDVFQPYITFNSRLVENEVSRMLLTKVRDAVRRELGNEHD